MTNPNGATMAAEINEAELERRDARVRKALLGRLGELEEEASEKRREAMEAAALAERIRKAVLNGKWWEIQGLLGAADVESLCNIGPVDRFALMDPDRE